MFVESHSTTLPVAPVLAWLISSSVVKVPGVGLEAILIAFVNLVVLVVTAAFDFLGFLNNAIFLKSFTAEKSPELALSVPSKLVFIITKKAPNSSCAFAPCPPLGGIITSNSEPDKLVAPAATIWELLIVAKVYPVPGVVTVTEVTAPPLTTTVATPPEPSPRIGIPVNVPLVPPEPGVLIFTTSIEPSTAADITFDWSELALAFDETAIKSVDKKFACWAAESVYINFHLYESLVEITEVDTPVGSSVEVAPPLLSKHL